MKGWGITTFPSHSDVFCLRCSEALGKEAPFAADPSLGVGSFRKRCPRCQLITSYDLSPAEAAAVELEEPDWKERFEAHIARWPKLPRYLAENEAFEQTLKEWRRFHAVDNKPAIAYEGMIALARLKILPPRSLIKDIERTGACFQDQHDSQMWLTMSQRAWRIVAIESRVLFLESFGEQTQVDLNRAKWEKYCEKAAEALEAMKKNGPAEECQ